MFRRVHPVESKQRTGAHASRGDSLVVVASDIEMGAGGPTDDCPHADWLGERLFEYSRGKYRNIPVELVFDGDTFDFLKTSVQGRYPHHVTEELALTKLGRIVAAHPGFFGAIRAFLASAPDRRHVHFVVGNHDQELLFPRVQGELRRLVGEQASFPGFRYERGELAVEHGSQGDVVFRVDPSEPFVEHEGRRILNLPWGAVGLLEIAMGYHATLHHLDRLRPRHRIFEALPEAKTLLLEASREYWLGRFWRGLVVDRDPLKRVSWPMLRDVVHRFWTHDTELKYSGYHHDALAADPRHRVLVVGHRHEADVHRFDGKLLLQTGCLRNEYHLALGDDRETPVPKSWAELRMHGERVVDARLVDVETPPAPKGHVPGSILELRPVVLRHLEELRARVERRTEPGDRAAA
ncbi:hypothetical protein L6R52_02650 [Myxococcota bacterium]|nr:hypothetical protein [Myxococcota bacterium]